MKKILITMLLFLVCSMSLNSQNCQWAEKIAGDANDIVNNFLIDDEGNIYVVGWFESTTLSFNNGKTLDKVNEMDGYLAKYNSNGQCQWAELITGNSNDEVHRLTIDAYGNVYIAGAFYSSTLTFNNGKTLSENDGGDDIFIAKYNSDGQCQWAEKIAGIFDEFPQALLIDSDDNLYIAGNFSSTNLTFNNGKTLSNNGNDDSFLAKYNLDGQCQWAESISGAMDEETLSITIDNNDNIYVVGYFYSTTLNFNNGKSLDNSGGSDGFIAKYNPNGQCQWTEIFEGDNDDIITSIAYDKDGWIYISGYFDSPKITFNNGKDLDNTGNNDIFITKYNLNGQCQWAELIEGTDWTSIHKLVVDNNSNIYATGYFDATTIYFNNGKSLDNKGYFNAFIVKYNPDGQCQWAESIEGSDYVVSFCIYIDDFSNVYVAGYFDTPTVKFNNGQTLNNVSDMDGFIAKYSQIDLQTQSIYLKSGWNIISSYIEPVNTSIPVVWDHVKENVIVVKNSSGATYIPAFNIDYIKNWKSSEGYQVYAKYADTLNVTGFQITPENTNINLPQGWSIISYLRNTPREAEIALATLTTNNALVIAKNSDGKTFIPQFGINYIGKLRPGDGYQVYLNKGETLTYPQNDIIETVAIGNQIFMKRNLDVVYYRNGDTIRHATSNADWVDAGNKKEGAWCYYNNDPVNGAIYGKLYNWYAVKDLRGLAPVGYHVPSDTEWTTLENYLKNNSQYWCFNNSSYIAKSLASKELWITNNDLCVIGNNLNSNNSTDFSAQPSGYRDFDGLFSTLSYSCYLWAATEFGDTQAWNRYLNYNSNDVGRNYNNKVLGFSVRCIKD